LTPHVEFWAIIHPLWFIRRDQALSGFVVILKTKNKKKKKEKKKEKEKKEEVEDKLEPINDFS
jgi:hypothetical protein